MKQGTQLNRVSKKKRQALRRIKKEEDKEEKELKIILIYLLINNNYEISPNLGLDFSVFVYNFVPILISLKHRKSKNIYFPNGPHIKPKWLNIPIRIYDNPNYYRNIIGSDNRQRSIIYQWVNLITGKIYVGSAWNGSTILISYWRPSVLKRNYPIYNNINYKKKIIKNNNFKNNIFI